MATRNFTGSVDGDLNNQNNYNGSGALLTTDDLVFGNVRDCAFTANIEVNSITISGLVNYAWNDGGYTITLNGSLSITDPDAWVGCSGTFKFKGTGTIYMSAANNSINNIEIDSGTNTVSLAGNFDEDYMQGNMTITSGTLRLAGYNLDVDGTFTVASAATLKLNGTETVSTPTFSADGSICEYVATSGTVTCKNWTYKTLKINGSGGTFQLGEAHTEVKTLTLTAGTFYLNSYQLTTATAFTVASGSTLKLNGTETVSTPTFSTGGIAMYAATAISEVIKE